MGDAVKDAAEDGDGARRDVPAVETIEATDGDAEPARREGEERDAEARRSSPCRLHFFFDDAQREESREEAAEREREEHHRVEEHRAARARLARDEVNEIGDEIRGVRKEEKPRDDQQSERNASRRAPLRNPGDPEREEEGNPCEEQIPDEERVRAGSGRHDARGDERNAERGGQPEGAEQPGKASEGHTRNRTLDALELFPMSKDAFAVARRLLCLEVLFQRLGLEEAEDDIAAREKARAAWAGRLDDLGIAGDFVADERSFLEQPVGRLSEDDLDDLEGRVSGALVLLWALGRLDQKPTFAMVTELEDHLEANGLLGDGSIKQAKAAAETATLRPADELDAALGAYL